VADRHPAARRAWPGYANLGQVKILELELGMKILFK
jgi:hypothetical protein